MNTKLIDEINDKTDIVELVSSYVKLERRGKNYFGLCPFHDDTDPSMSVSPERNIFKCFSCGVGGGPIKFYQEINHTTFREAVAALASPLGIDVPFKRQEKKPVLVEHDILEEVNKFYKYTLRNSQQGKEALDYLKGRKLKDETINHFQIGFSPKNDALYKLLSKKEFSIELMLNSGIVNLKDNEYRDFFNERIMFPITNISGEVVGFSGRALGDKTPKYYNSRESKVFNKSETLYHLHEALGDIRKQGYVIIHEGFFDCISSYEAGLKNTIATMGTALTISQAKMLENYTKRVVLAFDGDTAGVNAAIKAIEVLNKTKLRVDVLKFEENLDPDDYLKKYGKEKYLKLYEENLKDQYEFTYLATKENLNLSNINDANILKDATRAMLVNAPNSIKEIYIKRLSTDLNVSVSSINEEILRKVRRAPVKQEAKKPRKKELRPLKEKYYRAEIFLLISMFRNKEYSNKIEQSLGSTYVCDIRAFRLRTILHHFYYEEHDVFDEEKFKELLNNEKESEELVEFFNQITKSIEYKQGYIYEDEDVDGFIETIKEVNDEKGYNDLLKNVKDEIESYQKTILLEKQRKKRIKQLEKQSN